MALDSDLDGLPDRWEMDYGLNPQSSAGTNGGLGDFDNDGFSNIREFYLGSAPNSLTNRPVGMVAARGNHSMALTSDGRVWSWGYNSSGELGDGTTETKTSPVPVAVIAGMAKFVRIDTGRYFSLGLDEVGVLWAWGWNGKHQISKNATDHYSLPVKIELPAPVAQFACGDGHALVVDRNGKMWAWGDNYFGQLGAGHASAISGMFEIPKPSGMSGIVSLAASASSSYAIDAAGKTWSWGYNNYGQLGDGSNITRYSPVAVNLSTSIPAVKSISTGDDHVVATARNGTIWTWGSGSLGQLGSGNTSPSFSPYLITTGLSLANFSGAGRNHSLAVSQSGSVWCWGSNNSGKLGNSSTSDSYVPFQTTNVTDWSGIIQVVGGENHSCALKSDGSVWTWGDNGYGQLGHADTMSRWVATKISKLKLTTDDSDTDGLPDSWERHYFGGLSQISSGAYIANGVTNIVAYSKGLNPTIGDNDLDGISDSAEITAGLDPLDWSDATGDLDGDRIPNLWELNLGSSMTDSSSVPIISTITVDPTRTGADTATATKTIKAAVEVKALGNSNSPPYTIVRVNPGIYLENFSLEASKRILLLPANESQIPEIRGATGAHTVAIFGESIIDGFRITHSPGVSGGAVYSNPSVGLKIVRIVNCLIHGNSGGSGAGVYAVGGGTVLAHCSLFGNSVTFNGVYKGNGLYVDNAARTMLMNSIFWNPGGLAAEEIYVAGLAVAANTIVGDNSIAGTILDDPRLNRIGLLTKDSPARNKGTAKARTLRAVQGVVRKSTPDIGADEFIDTDGDAIPDWWEMVNLGGLAGSASNETDTPQFDRLINYYEYIFGFDPKNPDTVGNGLGDLYNAVFGYTNETWYPSEWWLDSDDDGLTDNYELYYQAQPSNPDTNGDGINDMSAILSGISVTSNDTDGDGITNTMEVANGTNPVLADTDGDGVNDNLDPLPLDPNVTSLPASSPSDLIAPLITLQKPSGAVLQP